MLRTIGLHRCRFCGQIESKSSSSHTSSSSSSSSYILHCTKAGDSDVSRWKKTDEIYENSANLGDGGTTCRQWAKRIKNGVDKYSPNVVVLVCGENDLSDRYAEEVFDDFRKVVEQIHAKGVDRVIYMGTKPEPDTKDLHKDYRDYDELIRDYYVNAEPDGKFTMIDVYPSFLAMGNPRSLYANDDLHLSKEGYNYWNAWLQSALVDNDCIRWQDGNCAMRTDSNGDDGGGGGGGDVGNNEDNNNPIEYTTSPSPTPTPSGSGSGSESESESSSNDPNFRYKGMRG